MVLSSDRYYLINGRQGQFKRTDIRCTANIFFMSDTNQYEWFTKKGNVIKSDIRTNSSLRKHFNKMKKIGEI